ncbi:growth factor receptor-bound protein 14-like isoform X3 [Athalia rosae]|uniref:growth factor receptor-bound protein 14-like isoform X3 n=1 Tax=Athalia rosae TaxID=37344 RepID=UPI00203409C0|nr:growth factor receptor-bound protein 14-like isoform X3 [Athalia rosae]
MISFFSSDGVITGSLFDSPSPSIFKKSSAKNFDVSAKAADMAERTLPRCLDAVSVASEGSLTQLVRPTTPEDVNFVEPSLEDPDRRRDDDEEKNADPEDPTEEIQVFRSSEASGSPSSPRGIKTQKRTSRGAFSAARDQRRVLGCCGINLCDWFPKMSSCIDGGSAGSGVGHPGSRGSYERLGSAPTLFELSSLQSLQRGQRDIDHIDNEKQEELRFYNDDNSYQTVVVEKNLCASDLCQLLALKNRVAKDVSWTIVESWPELGLERSLEDHEDVLSVHRDMESFAPQYERRFIFRKDFRKYEFFHDPQQFFPSDMVDFESSEFGGPFMDTNMALQKMLAQGGKCPPIFSSAWIRDPGKNVWAKIYMVLKGRKLYVTPKVQLVSRVMRQWRHRSESAQGGGSGTSSKRPGAINTDQLEVLAHLSDYHVYWTLNARKQFRAPTEWGICLRPSSNAETEDTVGSELRCITFDNEKARSCWIIAMRLTKLRENYRAFKNKQCQPTVSPKEYNSYTVPNESVRSRVAMDFTGSVGRIVEDPKEARAIAVAEGTSWKRRWRPASRPPPDHSLVRVQGLEAGVHITQPWFHSGMSRDQAANLVSKHGTVDGVFLVRESRSNLGAFVLTYKSGGKVLHTQIQPIMDHVRETYCYSLDSGVTKFYDLLQLVEFYQLNAGCLPTRLTHYVVQSPTGPVLQEEPSTSPTSSPAARQSPSATPPSTTPSAVTPAKPSSF